jgi:signal transduction histidine kinase
MQYTIYIIPWVISITLTLTMGIYALRRRQSLASLPFAAMCFFAAWWSFFYIIGVISFNLQFKLVTTQIMYIGVLGVVLSWTAFALAFSGHGRWLNRRVVSLVLIIPIITLILIWTNNYHHLYWSEIGLVTDTVTGLVLFYAPAGPWFWIHAVYTYGVLLFGTIFLIRQYLETRNIYRWQIIISLIAIIAPWIANALVVFKLIETAVDITSLTFSFSILILGWGYFRVGLLDLVPVAQRAVFNTIPDLVIVLDPNLRIVELNPASLRTFELGTNPRIGQPFKQVFGKWLTLDENDLKTNDFHKEVNIALDGTPERWYDLFINTLYDSPNHIAGSLLTLRDITNFKENEAALAIARDEAIRANNFKTQLLANVSHELRTPLGVITGYTDLMNRGLYGPITEKQTVSLSRIKESAQYLDSLVAELIDQAQLDSGRLQLAITSFEPREVFGQVFNQLSVLAEAKKLEFIKEITEEIPQSIVGDSQRLKQILVNLLGNAIKFTESGSVSARIYRKPKTKWCIQVSDSGPGIPEESLQVIFEPFRQLDHAAKHIRKGYGLGLSISKQIVELMEGEIKVESTLGKGTSFTVTLPLKTEMEPLQ